MGLRETNSLHCLLYVPPAFLSGCYRTGHWSFQQCLVPKYLFFILTHQCTTATNGEKNPQPFHRCKSQSTIIHLSASSQDLILSTIEEINVCFMGFTTVFVLPFRRAMSCSKITGSKGHKSFRLMRAA